jgi:Fuc2NAc and GlcNAc transferase
MFPISEIALLVFIFLLSFCLTYFYGKLALKRSVLDIPCERSSHETPTPFGGGIAIVISFYLCLLYSYFNGKIEKDLFFALLPGIALAFVGFVDDFRKLSTVFRLVVQIVCSGTALIFLDGFIIDNYSWLWSLIALFGCVWFINLFNFMDGSDGYASMEAISIALALWFFTGMNVILFLAFSVGGFLYWNFPKAKIFMGDVGSTTLGFILVVFGIYLHNNGSLNFSIWILITALFWFDATVTLFLRIIKREKLAKAHRNHIYQRAIRGGFSHLKVMLLGLGTNFLLLFISYAIWRKYIPYILGLILTLVILLSAMQYVGNKFAYKKQGK